MLWKCQYENINPIIIHLKDIPSLLLSHSFPYPNYSNPIRPAFGLRTAHVKPSNFCSMQKQVVFKRLAALYFFVSYASLCLAQGNGTSGIMQATSMVSSYFDPLTKLIYAVGAVVGLIGGIKVYQKFSSGDPDTSKTAASWFGACIFLVIAGTVLRSFFL